MRLQRSTKVFAVNGNSSPVLANKPVDVDFRVSVLWAAGMQGLGAEQLHQIPHRFIAIALYCQNENHNNHRFI